MSALSACDLSHLLLTFVHLSDIDVADLSLTGLFNPTSPTFESPVQVLQPDTSEAIEASGQANDGGATGRGVGGFVDESAFATPQTTSKKSGASKLAVLPVHVLAGVLVVMLVVV